MKNIKMKPKKPGETEMEYGSGRNPNSLKNLKKTAGPGRPKMTPEQKRINKAIRDYMKEYLENGEAVTDFEKIRLRKPEVALIEAMDRIYGKVSAPVPDGGRPNSIAFLVQVLCGGHQKVIDEDIPGSLPHTTEEEPQAIEVSGPSGSLIQATDCTLNAKQENAKFRQ